jgi:CHAT domain-containing protein
MPSELEGTQRGIDKTLLIWVIDPGGQIEFRKVELAAVLSSPASDHVQREDAAQPACITTQPACNGLKFYNYVRRASYAGEEDTRRMLYGVLIKPIADLLPRDPDQLVTFVPYGPFNLVPFAALEDPDGHWLIERHSIALAPSVASLERIPRGHEAEPATRRNALVAGIGEFKGNQPLPNAEHEAREVARMLGAEPVLGDRATKQLILSRLPEADIVDIATHASYTPSTDENVLYLADGEQLTADDVAKLHLKASIVVLSACQSAGGNVTAEGMVGLARAFLTAGARQVLVAMWGVNDEVAPIFVGSFYEAYLRTGSATRAVRSAMLTIARNPVYRDPQYWAEFELFGAPD